MVNTACSVDTQACFLGWEDPLEKGIATHSSILAWTEVTVHGIQRMEHNTFTFIADLQYFVSFRCTANSLRLYLAVFSLWPYVVVPLCVLVLNSSSYKDISFTGL